MFWPKTFLNYIQKLNYTPKVSFIAKKNMLKYLKVNNFHPFVTYRQKTKGFYKNMSHQ